MQTFALALHELATNAVKHGALSRPDGRLSVRWAMEAGTPPRLVVHWRERGVPPAADGRRRQGFGRDLIERALPYRLGAEVDYALGPEGLDCRIALPLEPGPRGLAA